MIINPIAGATYKSQFKTVNEVVNNSAAFQDDDTLILSVAANTTYLVDLYLIIGEANAAASFKWQFTGPAGATLNGAQLENEGATSAFLSQVSVVDAALPTGFSGGMTYIGSGYIQFQGFVKTVAASGILTLQWAQAAATVADTTVFKGSYLRIEKQV